MKFTLKDYQDEAVRDVLGRLRRARKRWREDADRHAFSLTAATGAGKTVMAAAVFEALLHGDAEREFDADPGAVVIWFSDDPSLNEQTRSRLIEASDRVHFSNLVVVENSFQREKFERGKIYFLNTQKLSRTSLLTRGYDGEFEQFPAIRPDLRSFTIWDTIQNTIEDPTLTLYLVLDEAHRGLGSAARGDGEKSTIVRRLINGNGAVPPIPVVWGISATVERFDAAMAGAQGRSTLPNVIVDPIKVQDSGLLKDTIILSVPDEVGQFDTVLVRRATDKIIESDAAWTAYAREQGGECVSPLMVLQVPNKPDKTRVGQWIDTILERWPDLKSASFANVFGEHRSENFGRHQVDYISPEQVQDATHIRVLIAKDAISTGWDCPRAEVMVSFRPANDKTYVTQLLGRMVRTPLARRIAGKDRLNSVDCILPFFDRKSVEQVADILMRGGSDGSDTPPPRRVLINPREMTKNPQMPAALWEKFESLPSQTLPQRVAKPVRRLTALAHELAVDGLLGDAGKQAHNQMHRALDAARVRFAPEIATARSAVMTVEGVALHADLKGGGKSFDGFLENADWAVIDDAFRRAARDISPDLARTYAEYLAAANPDADFEDALIDARADIAAVGLVPEAKAYLEREADALVSKWFDTYRVPIKGLTDERQEEYRQIKAMSSDPEDIDLVVPSSRWEPTSAVEADGRELELPRYPHHILCDDDGLFPAELNSWEQAVLSRESARDGFIGWYRNPARTSQDSLGVAYRDGTQWKILRPDFLMFFQQSDGTVAADIVDPHGPHLADALPKLKGLAVRAQGNSAHFRRAEGVALINDQLRVIDLTEPAVRYALDMASNAKSVYESANGSNY